METVTHLGRETAYRHVDRGGDGHGILFVHGSGADHTAWNGQLRLANRHPVTALDLSGHGRSDDIDAHPGYSALSAYADDVLAVRNATGASVLVGNSLGGAVVIHALLDRDPDVAAAVLTGTGARLGVLEDLLTWLDEDFERAIAFLHDRDRLFHDPEPELVERSKEMLRECGRTVTRRDFRTCHRFDERDRVSDIAVPALAVYGAYDQLTPPWYHEFLASEIPNADLAEIDDAAHLTMVERPAAFNAILATFLDSLEP